MTIRFKKILPDAKAPAYMSELSAGADLSCRTDSPVCIPAGETVLVHTGIAVELEKGYAGFLFARSSLASKRGLAPANKVGVIDADYRGEIMVALHNHGKETQTVENGERIAQLVVLPVIQAQFEETDALSDTQRGAGGFGSTGKI